MYPEFAPGGRTNGPQTGSRSPPRGLPLSEGAIRRVGMEPQNLVLILARDLADKLASAMFLIDHEGRLVYFNERAAEILGQSFGEVGRLPLEEWASAFNPTDFEDRPLDP